VKRRGVPSQGRCTHPQDADVGGGQREGRHIWRRRGGDGRRFVPDAAINTSNLRRLVRHRRPPARRRVRLTKREASRQHFIRVFRVSGLGCKGQGLGFTAEGKGQNDLPDRIFWPIILTRYDAIRRTFKISRKVSRMSI
jgi:hypothetical protein